MQQHPFYSDMRCYRTTVVMHHQERYIPYYDTIDAAFLSLCKAAAVNDADFAPRMSGATSKLVPGDSTSALAGCYITLRMTRDPFPQHKYTISEQHQFLNGPKRERRRLDN